MHGLEIKNGNNRVILSSEIEPYAFKGKARQTAGYDTTVKEFTINCPAFPLVFIYCPRNRSGSVVSVDGTGNGNYKIYVISDSNAIEVYCFVPASLVSSSTDFGLRLRNKNGTITYDSSKKPLVVRDGKTSGIDANVSFNVCTKPIYCYYPAGMRQTQVVTPKVNGWYEIEQKYVCTPKTVCNTVTSCSAMYNGGPTICIPQYVCNTTTVCGWVSTSINCSEGWNEVSWQIYRPAIENLGSSRYKIKWLSHFSGTFSKDYSYYCSVGSSTWASYSNSAYGSPPSSYFGPVFPRVGGGSFSEDNLPPYPNGSINHTVNFVLISDGSLYD